MELIYNTLRDGKVHNHRLLFTKEGELSTVRKQQQKGEFKVHIRSAGIPSKVPREAVSTSLEQNQGQEGDGGEYTPPHPGIDGDTKHGSL